MDSQGIDLGYIRSRRPCPDQDGDQGREGNATGMRPCHFFVSRNAARTDSAKSHASCTTATARPRDNPSHAASEGRYRGSDLAVTAGELNAGAGVGRLLQGGFC